MSTIAAGTTSGTALVSTGNTTGELVLQTNGTTTAVTIGTNQVVTLAQPLPVGSGGTGATSLSGLTTGTATNLAGGSDGTIPYQSAAGTTQMLAVGSAGQLLQTNGAGAPTWVAPPAGGSMIFLSTVTASNSSTVDIETTFNSTYDVYLLVASGIRPSVTNAVVAARLKIGGTYITTGTYPAFRMQPESQSNAFAGAGDTAANEIRIIGNVGDAANASANFSMYIYSPSSTSLSKMIVWTGASVDTTTYVRLSYGAGFNTGTSAMTGIRFFLLSGNIASGTFRLYGIKNS
jgi:hypothetical protein